jgi:hypothetical protein
MRSAHHIALATLVVAGSAAAQSEIAIEIDRRILRPGESASVRLAAAFPARYYALALVDLDLRTTTGSTGFSDLELIWPMVAPGASPGVATESGVEGVIAWQFPPFCGVTGCYSQLSNPIVIWRATYTAPDVVTQPFEVGLETVTHRFGVYETHGISMVTMLDPPVEGSAIIQVIGCYADCDLSGDLDLFDFLCFQNMFASGDPLADCDESGALDFFDFLCFQNEFAAGCP